MTVSNAAQTAGVTPPGRGARTPSLLSRRREPGRRHAVPAAPTGPTLVIPRTKPGATAIPLTLRWTNPASPTSRTCPSC